MHRPALLALALLITGATFTYAADPSNADKLKESQAKWEQARETSGGNYSYQVRWSSAFGFGNVTTVKVQGNKVVERKFEEFGRPEPVAPGEKPKEPAPKWVETGKDLGSHKEGVAAHTIDELYAEAKKLIDAPVAAGHVLSLGIDKQGLLNYCFTRDTRIADDAPLHGVRPFTIQLGTK